MSYNVLAVDDSPIIRAVLRKSIEMAGIEVGEFYQASDGLDALRVLADHWIDIMFLDLNMPRMGGAELVEQMAKDDALDSLPVVIVSAERNPEVISGLERRGVRAFISKPFKPENLKDIVGTVLEASGG